MTWRELLWRVWPWPVDTLPGLSADERTAMTDLVGTTVDGLVVTRREALAALDLIRSDETKGINV